MRYSVEHGLNPAGHAKSKKNTEEREKDPGSGHIIQHICYQISCLGLGGYSASLT